MKDHLDNSKLQLESHSVDDDQRRLNDVDESFACVNGGLSVDGPDHWQWTNLMTHSLNLMYAAVRVM